MNTAHEIQIPSSQDIKSLENFQNYISSLPGALVGDSEEYLKICPLKHSFVDGAYVREIFLPKHHLFITKIHKKTHPYFVMRGCVSVMVDGKIARITGPHTGITKAGTRRVIWTHEDTVWVTVHVTNKTDISEIEKEVIAKNFNDMVNTIEVKEIES